MVAAFEACDEDALEKALDAADPALLNHIPTLPDGMRLDDPKAAKWYRDNCFFNACTEFELGKRPLSLVSSAVYMLAHTWSQRRPQHALSRKTGYHRDEWISVFDKLISHKKIDLNAHNTEAPVVTYVPGTRDGWRGQRTGPRWRVDAPPSEPTSHISFHQVCPLGGGGLTNALVDDGMRAYDYACLIRDQQRLTENGGYARNLVSVMMESGKFAPHGIDLLDLLQLALPDRPYLDTHHMYLQLDHCNFRDALEQATLRSVGLLLHFVDHACETAQAHMPSYWNQALWYLRTHMLRRRKALLRKQLLGCVRWIARAHILLARCQPTRDWLRTRPAAPGLSARSARSRRR